MITEVTRYVIGHLIVSVSPRRRLHDLDIVDARSNTEEGPLTGRVEAALDVIARADPRRRARIGRDLSRIVILSQTGPEYWPELNACILNERVVRMESSLGLATTIVHEATHARIWARGIRYPDHLRARIERSCTRAEMRFLSRIPGTEDLQAKVKAREPGWWNYNALTDRYVTQLRGSGAPEWLVSLFRRGRDIRNRQDRDGADESQQDGPLF